MKRTALLCLAALAIPAVVEAGPLALNLRAGADMPLAASVGADLAVSTTGGIADGSEFLVFADWAVIAGVSAGTGGGEARLGYGLVGTGSNGLSLAAAATFLRTWGEPWNAQNNQSYAGLDAYFQDRVRVGLGVLFRVDGSEGRVMPRITLGFGSLLGL